jgi:hypothetical protein
MPATRTITSLSATITQASLVTAIQTAFTNAGFSSPVIDGSNGSDRVFAYAFSAGAGTFGTVHLRVRVTSPTLAASGSNASTEVSLGTLSSTIPCNFNALNGGLEYRLIMLVQGSVLLPLGLIAPSTRRGSWNLNSWSWGFIFTSSAMSVVRGSNLNQFASADYDGERDVLSNIVLLSQSNQGFAGRSSNELAIVSANGSTRFDTINITGTSQQYLIVSPGAGGFAVRIA